MTNVCVFGVGLVGGKAANQAHTSYIIIYACHSERSEESIDI